MSWSTESCHVNPIQKANPCASFVQKALWVGIYNIALKIVAGTAEHFPSGGTD